LELGPEQTDEELAAAEVGGVTVFTFTPSEWRAVCDTRGAQARVLELAETGGTVEVAEYVGTVFREWQEGRRRQEERRRQAQHNDTRQTRQQRRQQQRTMTAAIH
jgi:uncharacterized membrane protein YebE (DUF533 family)